MREFVDGAALLVDLNVKVTSTRMGCKAMFV
jgi:hypothetical protein